jgi:hypothetical protein
MSWRTPTEQNGQGIVLQLEVLEPASCEAVSIASRELSDVRVTATPAQHEGAASAQPWDVRTVTSCMKNCGSNTESKHALHSMSCME